MARTKLPATLQKGNTWSKEQLEELDKLEREMGGKDDIIEEVPEHLDEFGKVYYRYLVNNLRESKIPVSNLDKPTIEMVADCLSKIYQCQVAINEQGLTMTKLDKNGKEVIVANPHIKIMHDFQAKFIQMSSTLGLTPSARSTIASIRMNSVDDEQADGKAELDALIKKLSK